MNSSSRTASFGGSWPSFRNRGLVAYDAVSTSAEKVDSGCCCVVMKGFSSTREYASVFIDGSCSSGCCCRTFPPEICMRGAEWPDGFIIGGGGAAGDGAGHSGHRRQ